MKKLIIYPRENDNLMSFPSASMLRYLTLQTAGCVIQSCKEYEFGQKETRGSGLILSEKLGWNAENIIDGILAQVEFLYAIARREIEAAGSDQDSILDDEADYKILAEALVDFQKLQNEYSKNVGIKSYGPWYRNGVDFNTAEWIDIVKELLALQT